MMYVGVDAHKKVCRAAMVNDEGELVDEFSFRNCSKGIEDFMMRIEAFKDEALVAVESTANLWIRIYDFLEEHGIQVVLSNPSKTRLIAEARVKTDKVNARSLLSFYGLICFRCVLFLRRGRGIGVSSSVTGSIW